MSRPRRHFAAAALGGKIIVTDGLQGNEIFDPVIGAWTALTPMNTPRCNHAMVSANGKLYVAGGVDNNHIRLKSVECFDPTTRVWTTIAPMNEGRDNLGLAVLGDKLYAIGGSALSSVEYLDLSIPNGQWTLMGSMTIPRSGFGAVMTGGKIYAIEGYNTRNSMECFDPNEGPQGQWTLIHETLEFERYAKFAAI